MASGWTTLSGDVATFKSLEFISQRVFNYAFTFAGLAVFIMIISAAIGYQTSAGDPEKTKKAGSKITWAVAGLVLLIISWFILRLLSEFTGVDLTEFEIPGI